jgi:methylmalonyl-CoA mutase N-terminal domain/subunit
MTDALTHPFPVDDSSKPGEFPFTRGVYPTMYKGRLWTMRQYSGYANAKETNERYRYLLKHGQTGLSVAFDLPTQMGYDPDAPQAAGEVGKAGVSIACLGDIDQLFDQIPQEKVTVSMTINATAHILLALYQALAEKRGVAAEKLGGTVQNDVLKEFIARGTYIYPPEASMKICTDVIEHCVRRLPQWNFISVSGYHIREAGSTAAQELGFTMANGLCYMQHAIARRIDPNEVGRRISFFFNAHNNFLEEIAKFRAARRLWARLMKERFKATDERAMMCRFHTQTAGSTLTSQQPENNVVRVALQAMAAVLGGTQSLHTNSFDEALALPTEKAATIALRTQQIIGHEIGVRDIVDPFGGSWHIEKLTKELEQQAEAYIGEVEKRGGAIEAIKQGYYQQEIEKSALQYQREIEEGKRVIVGVNKYVEPETSKVELLKIDQSLQKTRAEEIRKLKAGRGAVQALDGLRQARDKDENLMPAVLDCVRANVTLGEISAALQEKYGRYDPSTVQG